MKKTDFQVFSEIDDQNTPKGIRASLNQLVDVQTVTAGGTVKVGVSRNLAQDLMQMVIGSGDRYHIALYVIDANEFDKLKAIPAEVTFEQFAEEFTAWSLPTFKEATAMSSLEKMAEEMLEIEHALHLPFDNENRFKETAMEYADALMCLIDSADRAGITTKELIKSSVEKLKVNKARKWEKNPDNNYSHKK